MHRSSGRTAACGTVARAALAAEGGFLGGQSDLEAVDFAALGGTGVSEASVQRERRAWEEGLRRLAPDVELDRTAVLLPAPNAALPASGLDVHAGPLPSGDARAWPLPSLARLRLPSVVLWRVDGGPQRFRRRPVPRAGADRAAPTVLVQLAGTTVVEQAGRTCELGAGGLAFIDGTLPSVVWSPGPARRLFAELPPTAAGLLPAAAAALPMDGADPANRPLYDFVRALWDAAALLRPGQRDAVGDALAALARLTSAAQCGRDRARAHVRVERAVAFVEGALGDPGLTPAAVAGAQGVTRRHLDGLFARYYGLRVDTWIWERRLVRAAGALRSPARAHESVLQVALACGFRSASHFARLFRRRFGVPPSAWRRASELPSYRRAARVALAPEPMTARSTRC